MVLKDTWTDKVDDIDDVLAEDINSVAHGVIDIQDRYQSGAADGSTQNAKSVAGGKGYVITAVSEANEDGTGTYTLSSVAGLEVDMPYSVYLRYSSYNAGKILSISGNNVTVDGYRYIELRTDDNDPDGEENKNIFMAVGNPNLGDTQLAIYATAEGVDNIAADKASHVEGRGNIVQGNYGHAEGYGNYAVWAGHAEGYHNENYAPFAHIEGHNNIIGSGAEASHVEGGGNKMYKLHAHAEGAGNTVDAIRAHAEGSNNKVYGPSGHVEGNMNTTSGEYSHVEGLTNTEQGSANHVAGFFNTVNGIQNCVNGQGNNVTGNLHDVSGQGNVVSGNRHIVSGRCNIASGWCQFVTGEYNKEDRNQRVIIGGGSSESDRKNVFTIDQKGNVEANSISVDTTINGTNATEITNAAKLADNYVYVLDNYKTIQDLLQTNNVTVSCVDGAMCATHTSQDPNILRRFSRILPLSTYTFFKIKYKITGMAGTLDGKIYYSENSNFAWSENDRVVFDVEADGRWHTAVIRFAYPIDVNYTSIGAIRIDIPNNSDSSSSTYIKYFGFFHTEEEANYFDTATEAEGITPMYMSFSSGSFKGRMTLTSMRIFAMQVGSLVNSYTITMSKEFAEAMRAYYNGAQPQELIWLPAYPQGPYSVSFDYDRKEVNIELWGGEDGYDLPATTILFGY